MDKKIFKYFTTAWEMLTDFPLPRKVVSFDHEEQLGIEVERAFPIVGLLLGVVILLFGLFLSAIMKSTPAALLFAIVMTILAVAKDSGRSLGSLISFIELKTERVSTITAIYHMKGNIRNTQSAVGILTLVLMVFFYLLVFFLMSLYHFYYWMILVLTLEFTIQGHLATVPSISSRQPLLDVPVHNRIQIWLIAGFIALFILFSAPYATLIVAAVAFLGGQLAHQFCARNIGGISTNIIGFAGLLFEIIALLIGLIFLAS